MVEASKNTEAFRIKGIGGPPYELFHGNVKVMKKMAHQVSFQNMGFSHNILARVLSFYHQWRKSYGEVLLLHILSIFDIFEV
jgi:PHYB activation tagged suppressor 1